MQQNFEALKSADISLNCITNGYEQDILHYLLSHISTPYHRDDYRKRDIPIGYSLEQVRNDITPIFNDIKDLYAEKYKALFDWKKADVIIISYHFDREILREFTDAPIIYYPIDHQIYVSNVLNTDDDEHFVHVIHDESMKNMYSSCKTVIYIKSSLNPLIYKEWNGSINSVLTVFNNLDASSQLSTRYIQLTSGFRYMLYGHTVMPKWLDATYVNPFEIHNQIRNYRCALHFSRSFTSISSEQLLATGVPSIGYVDSDHTMNHINQEAILVSQDIQICRERIKQLLKNQSYAKEISDITRESYYICHQWDEWTLGWSNLIHRMYDGVH